jgi:predicted amidohydrolase
MRDIRIGAAQFEARDADKEYNLGRIEVLTRRAVEQGAQAVCFHECCICGYTFLMTLTRDQLAALAEPVPDGPSTRRLIGLARKYGVALLAGLVEKDDAGRFYNTCVCVNADGFVARHRKLHTFISKYLTPGNEFTVFDLAGCRAGILICYDNNLPENVRITALMGAEVVFMPHVTCGLPSPMPGRGKIAPELWEGRERDPVRLRLEFEGPKGRGWLMRWLPARAYENGVYAVFTNPVGVDHDTIKTGNAMILDSFGEVLVESHALGDDVVVALCSPEKIPPSYGRLFLRARRPELYGRLLQPNPDSATDPGWKLSGPKT